MRDEEAAAAVLEELEGAGWEEVEVFHKRGRSRTLRHGPAGPVSGFHREEGWTVRAGDRRRSFFYGATGAPTPASPWPEADGAGLRLPAARTIPEWPEPSELEAPLIGEGEALAFFEGLARELDTELPGARLMQGTLEDGSSESRIASSRGVRADVRRRTATLRVEGVAPGGGVLSGVDFAARSARRLSPAACARRLADRLLVAAEGTAPERDRGELLIAPPVAVRLLAAFSHLWLGPDARRAVAALADRRGKAGSRAFTLVDDGRLAGGLLDAPADGEGQPTREVVLVDEGTFRQPLLAWWQGGASEGRPSGCSLRPGWRDLPRPGPTHLYLRPESAHTVASLLADVGRGYYLLDVEGGAKVDAGEGRFALPVCGFVLEAGRAKAPLAGAALVGSIGGLFRGLQAAARDLTFTPLLGGMIGSPTLRVKGMEVRRRAAGAR